MYMHSINTSTNYTKITNMWRHCNCPYKHINAHAFLNTAARILYSVRYSDAKVQDFLATEPINKRCIACY
jgi:hypothetical protein